MANEQEITFDEPDEGRDIYHEPDDRALIRTKDVYQTELDNGVEGFVPASSLTATGTTLTEGIRLSDPASGKTWSLGDSMMITIVRADINLGKVDFEVAPETK